MKKEIICREFLSLILAIVITGGALFLSAATTYAQIDPCKAKANYEAAKAAAERAALLPKDGTEQWPEEKVKERIEFIKSLIKDFEKRLHQAKTQKERDHLNQRISVNKQRVKDAEQSLQTRMTLDEAKRKKEDYLKASNAKDAALKNARAFFDKEQANIQRVRASLDGRPQDAAYIRDVTTLLTRTRANYERLLMSLSPYDCFADVRGFMDDLKQRMKKIDANMTIVRNASPTPARPSVPVSPPAPAPPRKASSSAEAIAIGKWEGRYENSEGGKGYASIEFFKGADGKITGREHTALSNVTVSGNVISWTYRVDCRTFTGSLTINADGRTASGRYMSTGCKNYSGVYINYTKK